MVVIGVTLVFAFTLAGTQCAVKELTTEATVVVAAQDSPADLKAQADYVGDGAADEVEIQSAVDAIEVAGGGKVLLLEGTFFLSKQVYLKSRVTLQGQGYDTLLMAEPGTGLLLRVKNATDVVISDLRANANGIGSHAIDVIESSKRVIVENVWAFNAIDDEISVVHYSEDVIIRNNTVKGDYGGKSKANIETGDEVKRVTISKNTLLGGHEDRMGIHVNRHPGQYDWGEDIVITENTISGVKTDGIRAGGHRITISGNSLSNIGGYGIKMTGGVEHNINDNILDNVNINNGSHAGIFTFGPAGNLTVTGNEVTGARGAGIVIGSNSDSALVEYNLVRDCGAGIQIAGNSRSIMIRDNICKNNGESGVQIVAPATKVMVANNHASGAEYGIKLGKRRIVGEHIDGIVLRDNNFDDNSAGWLLLAALVKNLEIYPSLPPHSVVDCFDWFPGALAASINYVHTAIAGTVSDQIIIIGITNPDVPRNISVTATDNAAPLGNVLIEGINARGDTDSEEIAIIAGDTAYGNKAFATITKIIIPASLTTADTVRIGISDKLGLSYPIYATTDVFKVLGTSIVPTVDVTNGTLDFTPIKTNPDPRFPNIRVWYKTPLKSD